MENLYFTKILVYIQTCSILCKRCSDHPHCTPRNFPTSMCINSNFCINWLRFHVEDHLQWWQLGLWLKSSSLQQFSIEESIVSKPEGSVSNVETRKVLIGCALWIAGHRESLSTRSHVATWGVWGGTFSRNNYNCFPSCHCVPAQSTLIMQEFLFFCFFLRTSAHTVT